VEQQLEAEQVFCSGTVDQQTDELVQQLQEL